MSLVRSNDAQGFYDLWKLGAIANERPRARVAHLDHARIVAAGRGDETE
jgi:hypothetical protein